MTNHDMFNICFKPLAGAALWGPGGNSSRIWALFLNPGTEVHNDAVVAGHQDLVHDLWDRSW